MSNPAERVQGVGHGCFAPTPDLLEAFVESFSGVPRNLGENEQAPSLGVGGVKPIRPIASDPRKRLRRSLKSAARGSDARSHGNGGTM